MSSPTRWSASAVGIKRSGTPDPDLEETYDIVIIGLDDGKRSAHIASRLRPAGNTYLALSESPDSIPPEAFPEFEIVEPTSGLEILNTCLGECGRSAQIALDVTGLQRSAIARVIGALWDCTLDLTVDLLYAPADFDPSGLVRPVAMVTSSVGSAFTGSPLDAGLPVALALGLGYERHVSVGALDQLGPSIYWSFEPVSFDPRYDEEIETANQRLFLLDPPAARFRYRLAAGESVYRNLVEAISSVRHTHQVIAVPFGPRLFTAICCFAAGYFKGDVEVAQVTSRNDQQSNQEADGRVAAVRLIRERYEEKEPS